MDSDLNLLTVFRKINEPGAIVVGAVVVREIGRSDDLTSPDDPSTIWYPVADVETYAGYRRVRLQHIKVSINYMSSVDHTAGIT